MFNEVNRQDLLALQKMFPGRVFDGRQINEDYYHDELGTAFGVPEILVKVLSTEEVSAVMRYA